MNITQILSNVQTGEMSVSDAENKIRYLPFEDIKYAVIDHQRELRVGVPEVIYGAGKTTEQIAGITKAMLKNGAEKIMITRTALDTYNVVRTIAESGGNAVFHEDARIITIAHAKALPCENPGKILVITAGTSDIPVSEEAAVTAEFLGNKVERLYDVGVAGIHRLLSRLDIISSANVIIVVAGMEGALASVVGGLTNKPVIAVPTSVGYGASFGGIAALLTMLNSCASGVATVNIDNGFGAGYLANNINSLIR